MTRRLRVALATVGALVVGLMGPATGALGTTSPASAGHLVQGPRDIFWPAGHHGVKPSNAQLRYHGGLHGRGVQHHPKVYLVFWGSQWNRNDPYAAYEQRFFRGLYGPGDDWTALQHEYCDHVSLSALSCGPGSQRVGRPFGGLVKGVWFDNSAPAIPTDTPYLLGLTPDSVAQEVARAAAHFGNTTPAKNVDVQYLINEPSLFDSPGYGPIFCAYHSYVDTNYGPLSYADLPNLTDLSGYCGGNAVNGGSAGKYDGVSIVAGHEFIETLTDPYPNRGWMDTNSEENADKCAWQTTGDGAMTDLRLSTGTFAVQGSWSNLADNGNGGCRVHAGS